ncbi:hypothetical protein [Thiospirillum jenense]|uniref:hypothetical protein n=1 Tax=Thiospirillum jenense TaxID=1653858 RepID=UPI0015FDEFEA|nr:hypothetical protein [Thiospirillum jenense]
MRTTQSTTPFYKSCCGSLTILPDLRAQVLNEGLYVARIHEGVFQLDTPADFQPKVW